jgi:hypothetical protein
MRSFLFVTGNRIVWALAAPQHAAVKTVLTVTADRLPNRGIQEKRRKGRGGWKTEPGEPSERLGTEGV